MFFAPVARADASDEEAQQCAAGEPAVPPGINRHLQNERSAANASPRRVGLAASAVTWPGRAESVCDSGAGSRPEAPRGTRSAAPGPCARSPLARELSCRPAPQPRHRVPRECGRGTRGPQRGRDSSACGRPGAPRCGLRARGGRGFPGRAASVCGSEAGFSAPSARRAAEAAEDAAASGARAEQPGPPRLSARRRDLPGARGRRCVPADQAARGARTGDFGRECWLGAE